ncbi:MAG: hypothetical protein ACTS9Y_00250 [Methylophilus sp.]|uniref:hypothetical protein n=1 Tax=Methylophilus sp. TaxID=29541 RepID=UPI003F9F5835
MAVNPALKATSFYVKHEFCWIRPVNIELRNMQTTTDGPKWHDRARRVAEERFPGIDLDSEYYSARLLPKKGGLRTKVKAACAKQELKWIEEGFKGRYYKVSPKKLCFVVASPELIIHVLSLV